MKTFLTFFGWGLKIILGCLWLGGLIACGTKEKKTSPSSAQKVTKPAPAEKSPYRELITFAKQKRHQKLYSLAENRLAENEKDKVTLNALAMYHYQRGKYDLAEFVLKLTLKHFPKDVALYNNMALVQSAKGDLGAAFSWLRKGLRLNSRHSILRLHLASLYVEVKNYKMAYKLFAALKSEGKLRGTENLNHYAMVLMGIGQAQRAKAIYEKLMASSTQVPTEAFLNYSYLLLKHFKYPERALAVLKKIPPERINSQLQRKYQELYNKAKRSITDKELMDLNLKKE